MKKTTKRILSALLAFAMLLSLAAAGFAAARAAEPNPIGEITEALKTIPWDKITEAVKSLLDQLKPVLKNLMDLLKPILKELGGLIK